MQANYIANFLGNGCVLSYYVPYWCEGCRKAESVLIRTTEGLDPSRCTTSHPRCLACQAPLQLAEVEDECFGYARRQGPVEPPVFAGALEQAIEQLALESAGQTASAGPAQ
jgi:hypothetical protein